MKKEFLNQREAVASAVDLCSVDFVPYFPDYYAAGITSCLKKGEKIQYESQGSMLQAGMAMELSQKRVFIAVSRFISIEELHMASFLRMPLVIANVSRSIGVFTNKCDDINILSMANTGCLMFMADSSQDALDSIMQAYKVCEDNKVLLPAIVNIENPTLRQMINPVSQQSVKGFIPKFRIPHGIDIKKPHSIGGFVGNEYPVFLSMQQKSMKNARIRIEKLQQKWKSKFRRSAPMIESYKTEDANIIIAMIGTDYATTKVAVDKLREKGDKVGALRLRVLRPFPSEELSKALEKAKKIAVIDNSISLGSWGMLYKEVKPFYSGIASNFIAIQKLLSEKDIMGIYEKTKKSDKPEKIWIL